MQKTAIAAMLLCAGITASPARACDICGCNLSNQNLGLLPQFSQHFVGIQYMLSSTESKHPSIFEGNPDEVSSQKYQSLQIWGKYQLSRRFQLFGFLPYVSNSNSNYQGESTKKGIADASVSLNYAITLKEKRENIKQILLAGAGIKIPLGRYDAQYNASSSGLPNPQTGSGSWDILNNVNYTLKNNKWGVNADLTYLYTTANKRGYKYGNRLNISGTLFYWLQYKKTSFVTQAGIKIENALHDYSNYEKKWLNLQTGGTMSFASVGFQVYYKSLGIKIQGFVPAYQHYANGYVKSHARIETGIIYLF